MRIALAAPPWEVMANSYPPLGLAYLSSRVKQDGFEARIFDFGLTPDLAIEDAAAQIGAFDPDVVGISTWTHTYAKSVQLAQAVRRASDAVTVFGGPHASIFPQDTAREPDVDYVVYGEGEETFAELCRALRDGDCVKDVEGLCYERDDEIVQTAPRPLIKELDRLPFPDRDGLRIGDYPLKTQDGQPMTTVLTSRGCPYRCVYCYKGLFGTRYRQRSAEGICDEVEQIVAEYGIRNMYFVDDLFVFNTKRLERFLALVRERNIQIDWQCLARVDRLEPEHYEAMADAGCVEIHFGVESGDPGILKAIGKRISPAQVRSAVSCASQAGIRTKGYFMTGLPGDTMGTMRKTLRFACGLGLDDAMFSLTTPLPGTELWERIRDDVPGLNDPAAFADAFYFAGEGRERTGPLFNFSHVSDEDLVAFTRAAPGVFWKRSVRRQELQARFGRIVGWMMWRASLLSALPAVRQLRSALKRKKAGTVAAVPAQA